MSTYAQHEHHDFPGASTQALADPTLQQALTRLTDTLLAGNRRGYAALADSSDLRDHAKRIKEHTLAHLDRYLDSATYRFNTRKMTDGARFASALAQADGRRLTYEELTERG